MVGGAKLGTVLFFLAVLWEVLRKVRIIMYDPSNPYASPVSTEMHPVAAQWLGTPSPSLQRVANGLGMVFAGNILLLVIVVGVFGIGIAFAQDVATLAMVDRVVLIAARVALGLTVAGGLFCLATPSESGAKGMIVVSVGATLFGLFIQLCFWLGAIGDSHPLLINLLSIVAGITFLIFLRLLSRFIGRYDLGRRAISILVWSIISTSAFVGGTIMMVAALGWALLKGLAEGQAQAEAQLKAVLQTGAGGALLGTLFILIAVIIALVTYVRYVLLLAQARTAILTGGRG
jgi:hypothetical protein